MRIKYCWLSLILPLLLILASCSSSPSLSSTGTGFLWLTAQGNTTVQAYTINTGNGSLSRNGNAVATGNAPISIVITPKGDAAFISNSGTGSTSGGGISAYTINSDGTFKVAGSTIAAGPTPLGMAINPAGTFLFVANQGSFDLTHPGSISVFAVSGASLTPVNGSPFSTEINGGNVGTGPVSVAVSASGNYLYVANQFANTVSSFQISSSGALSQPMIYPVGLSPSAVFVSIAQGTTVPAGQYLYVANAGSNNISGFAICDAANALGCSAPNGLLTPLAGSPFAAEPGPVAIAMDPTAPFLYAADEQANQISEYRWSSSTGVLSPLTPAIISAGGSPVSLAIRPGIAATLTNAGTDYLYAANLNASSVSVYTLNTTTGGLNVLGSPVTTPAQPSAVIVR
ncbi:MAG TPA: beta-propeller fold lactonase family protein [Terriglobales bacterium]|nr:beta-propeller fold lactonase family protein [Terriglobales bacterium]